MLKKLNSRVSGQKTEPLKQTRYLGTHPTILVIIFWKFTTF